MDKIIELFGGQTTLIQIWPFTINLILAAITAFVVSVVYIYWGSALSNRRRFAANFVMLTITTMFIISVVKSSLALSLGLVGALSITRFRAAIKDPEELAYIFLTIGLGIGFGANQPFITTITVVAAIVVIGLRRLFRKKTEHADLQVTVAANDLKQIGLEDIVHTLENHCKKLELVRFDEGEHALEASFMVEFRGLADLTAAKTALRNLSQSVEVTFLDLKGVG